MADRIFLGAVEHLGIRTALFVEEGRNFRRLVLARERLMFSEWQEMGKVHIYQDEVGEFIQFLAQGKRVMDRVGEIGLERTQKEVSSGSF